MVPHPWIRPARVAGIRTLSGVGVALCFLVSLAAGAGRERLLLDFGWRFHLGDPAGLNPDVFAYPEVDALERTARAHLDEEPKLIPLRRSAADINAAPPVLFAQS